ncbi:MAG: hypothetical protein WC141_10800 [Arcobacteraceae bacterium]
MIVQQEKITINHFPKEFQEYYQKREAEKLKKSAEIMVSIYEEDEELKSWTNFEDIHEPIN